MGLIRDALNNLNHTIKYLHYFTYPCLFLQGEKDAVFNYKEIIRIFRRLKTDDKTFKLIENGFHELYSDVEKEGVTNIMVNWILDRCDRAEVIGDVKNLRIKLRKRKKRKSILRTRNVVILVFYLYIIRM